MNDSELCKTLVRTVDNQQLPCKRKKEHQGGHNPFSDTAPADKLKTQ